MSDEKPALAGEHFHLIKSSFTYRALSTCVKVLNLGGIKLVKRVMYWGFARPHNREDLPRWMYQRFSVESFCFQGYPVYTLTAENSCRNKAILFLHGGGGRMRPTALHYHTASWLLEHTDRQLVFPFYPLAPKANAAEARVWMEDLYAFLNQQQGMRHWIFLGDSAGANLSARLLERHPDWAEAAVLFSPAAGVDHLDAMRTREAQDLLLDTKMLALIAETWSRGLPLNHPDVNAAYTDYRQFPPVFLCYGAGELFAPYVRQIGGALLEQVRGAQVYEGQEHCHDWMLAGFLPETRELRDRLAAFLSALEEAEIGDTEKA